MSRKHSCRLPKVIPIGWRIDMDKYGSAMICTLENVSDVGDEPQMRLVPLFDAFYEKQRIGVTRLYAAMGAGQEIAALIKLLNVEMPDDGELYAVIAGKQYRVAAVQDDDFDAVVTLRREGDLYDVADN